MMKLKNMPIYERPREKLLRIGADKLSDAELLAIIIKTGTKDESALDVSYNILNLCHDVRGLKDISYNELFKLNGVGSAKAISILALVELSKRIYFSVFEDDVFFDKADVIYEKNKYLFCNLTQEYFYCLYLDSKKKLLARKLLFVGTLNKSVVHPREIFKEAYKCSASCIICLHNHPSGDITPSVEDIKLTQSLIEIGKMNGIPVIDHIIFGNNSYYSFYNNMIKNEVRL